MPWKCIHELSITARCYYYYLYLQKQVAILHLRAILPSVGLPIPLRVGLPIPLRVELPTLLRDQVSVCSFLWSSELCKVCSLCVSGYPNQPPPPYSTQPPAPQPAPVSDSSYYYLTMYTSLTFFCQTGCRFWSDCCHWSKQAHQYSCKFIHKYG